MKAGREKPRTQYAHARTILGSLGRLCAWRVRGVRGREGERGEEATHALVEGEADGDLVLALRGRGVRVEGDGGASWEGVARTGTSGSVGATVVVTMVRRGAETRGEGREEGGRRRREKSEAREGRSEM